MISLQTPGDFSSSSGGPRNLRNLEITATTSLVLFILALELLRYSVFAEVSPLIAVGLVLPIAVIFAFLFLRYISGSAAKIHQRYAQHNRELSNLNEISQTAFESLELDVMLPQTLRKLAQLTAADSGDLFLYDGRGREMSCKAHIGDPTLTSDLGPLIETELIRKVVESHKTLIVQDTLRLQTTQAKPLSAAGFRSLAAVPLIDSEGTAGLLVLLAVKVNQFSPSETGYYSQMGTMLAAAIANARCYERVRAVAVAEERERISHELHDGLAQVLGFVITKSQATRQMLRKMAAASDYLVDLENAARNVYTDTREDILGLRIPVSEDRDLISALREYLKQFSQMHGIKATLEVGDQIIPRLSPQIELQAIRIAQEALSNIRKHAEATCALIKVAATGSEVTLIVQDDGKGFDAARVGSDEFSKFGIRTSKERADGIHSQLTFESSPGKGTKVTLRIPLNLAPSSMEKSENVESNDR